MPLWLVRAGRDGERENFALDQDAVVLGWDELPDLSGVQSREEIASLIAARLPDAKPQAISNWSAQIWMFVRRIAKGDHVVLPLKSRAIVAVGKIIGEYEYHAENPDGAKHLRKVTWINKEIPRPSFDQDLLYSLGAFSTVCQIKRHDAEQRIIAIAQGKKISIPPISFNTSEAANDLERAAEESLDLKANSNDQIRKYIARKFSGHDLARLVGAVLEAQGYHVQVSMPGADGGADILAAQGTLGFGEPTLCVQVKSGTTPSDATQIRELDGVMNRFGAKHGLFVSWGSFRRGVKEENRREFFRIRLWESDDLISAIVESYDKLPEEIKSELPLQRIWVLVPQE